MRITYRFNGNGTSLSDRIGRALTHFQKVHHALPVALIVSPKNVEEAQRVADQVVREFAKEGRDVRLPVVPVGGCLANEVWLDVGEVQIVERQLELFGV